MEQWFTRERPKIDRMACPWRIARFIDQHAEFVCVPAADVPVSAESTGAVPCDLPAVEMSHVGELCRFDTRHSKYGLREPAQQRPAVMRALTDRPE